MDTHTPVLTENKDLFIDNGGQMNFLIEGDNLASLQLLEKTHKGKINLIYIDPPYNTGSKDWCYVKITDTLNLCFLVKSAKCTNWSHLFHGLLDNEPLMA